MKESLAKNGDDMTRTREEFLRWIAGETIVALCQTCKHANMPKMPRGLQLVLFSLGESGASTDG